jgi:hypothetical protein
MASKGKIVAVVLGLAAIGGVAYAASQSGEDEDAGEAESGGMLLGEGCSSITIIDLPAFVHAMIEFFEENDVAERLELDERADARELLVAFLREHFEQCEWPPAGTAAASFTWHSPLPDDPEQFSTRSWRDVVDDIVAANRNLAGAINPGSRTADALAYDDYVLEPGDTEPEPERPLPPIPPFEPDGDGLGSQGGGGDIIPDNVLEAVDVQHMMDAGIERAMESGGGLSPLPSAVILVYDPQWPDAEQMLAWVADAADDNPEIFFVLATVDNTQAAFGLPEQLGLLGMAANAANRVGRYKDDEAAAVMFEEQVPGPLFWRELIEWALGPGDSKTPRPFRFSSAGQKGQPGG